MYRGFILQLILQGPELSSSAGACMGVGSSIRAHPHPLFLKDLHLPPRCGGRGFCVSSEASLPPWLLPSTQQRPNNAALLSANLVEMMEWGFYTSTCLSQASVRLFIFFFLDARLILAPQSCICCEMIGLPWEGIDENVSRHMAQLNQTLIDHQISTSSFCYAACCQCANVCMCVCVYWGCCRVKRV